MITFAFTYDVVTPESAENGDTDDHGFFVDGCKYSMMDEDIRRDIVKDDPDSYRSKWQPGVLEEVITQARLHGICEASDSDIGTGTWFSSIDPDCNFVTGEDTTYALHVDGVTRATMKRIHRLLNDHSGLNIYNKCQRLAKWIKPVRACIDDATRDLGLDLSGFAKFDLVLDNFNVLNCSDVRIILEVLRRDIDPHS